MIKVSLSDSTQIRVNWRHNIVPLEKKSKRFTECMISSIENGDLNELGMGRSQCMKTDIYTKSIGRKLTLARALKNSTLNKEDRTIVWNAYNENSRK